MSALTKDSWILRSAPVFILLWYHMSDSVWKMLNKMIMKKGKQYFRIIMKRVWLHTLPWKRIPVVPRLYFDNCFSKDSTPHFYGNRFSRYCTTALAFNSTFLFSLKPEEMEERIRYSLASLKLAIRVVVFEVIGRVD